MTSREAFTIDRRLEYFSESELTKQIGHAKRHWPLVVLKELIDNAIDNCEENGILPDIEVHVTAESITVTDNGTGIPPATVTGMLDFGKRISSREAYRTLSRGAMGNAGKCMLAIPFVIDGTVGVVDIESQGIRHHITVELDAVEQSPKIDHRQTPGKVKNGTSVTVNLACQEGGNDEIDFLLFADQYADLNPHLTLHLAGDDHDHDYHRHRTVDRIPKWSPKDPDPPAWYDEESFERLLAATMKADRDCGGDRSVRDFVKGFAGLSGSANLKKVSEDTGTARASLTSLLNCNEFDEGKVKRLLASMQRHGRKPKPTNLGCVGRSHVEYVAKLAGVGGEVKYKKVSGEDDRGLPFVVEAAFGEIADRDRDQLIVTGCNFSPSLNRWITEDFGALLYQRKVDDYFPALILLHIAQVDPVFLNRGKSVLDCGRELRSAITTAIESVTRDHYQRMKAAERTAEQRAKKACREERSGDRGSQTTVKDAVFRVLEEAVETVSNGHRYEFNNRELFYIVRPLIQDHTDRQLTQSNFDAIVDQYEKENGLVEGRNRDPRGYLLEPHKPDGENKIPLGTKEVDNYEIPLHLYNRILYVEKKNLLNKLGTIGDKYDMAIMAAEGYSVRAGKALLEAAQSGHRMQVFCLHDADPHGYNIARTLSRDSGAHKFNIEVIDLGFSITEAIELGLPTETFTRKKSLPKGLKLTDEERRYFEGTEQSVTGKGGKRVTRWVDCQRVELNALSAYPDRFIEWLENKLQSHGVTQKLIPPDEVIATEAERTRRQEIREEAERRLLSRLDVEAFTQRVCDRLVDRVDIDHATPSLKDWQKTLTTDRWLTELHRLVDREVDKITGDIDTEVDREIAAIVAGGDQ